MADKTRIAVEPIRLDVVGGTFTVREVYASSTRDVDAIVDMIRTTATERWFVMLAEGRETSLDELALIDDALEFQSVATGVLEGE